MSHVKSAICTAAQSSEIPRVLHVFPRLTLGGADRAVLDFVRLLPEFGYDCTLCVLNGDTNFPDKGILPENIVSLDMPWPFRLNASVWLAAQKLRRLAEEIRPAIIHSHLWPADIVCAASNLSCAYKHVSHQQGTGMGILEVTPRATAKRWISRALLRLSGTQFIAVSEAVRSHVGRVYRTETGRVEIIYNGFDRSRFPVPERPACGEILRVGFAGRLAEEKGIFDLLKSLQILAVEKIPIDCKIAGEGPLRSRIEEMIRGFGIAEKVSVIGPVHDMARFYRSIDVFVLPSHHSEGLPLAITESMAMGCVTVAADVAGACEVITDRVDGYIFPPRDVQGLAARLRSLAEGRQALPRLAAEAMRTAESKFEITAAVEKLSNVYSRIISDR